MNLPGRIERWARGCPPGWQITRAVSEDDGPFAVHIESCPTCAAEYRRLRELVVRAGVLGASDGMSHETRQAISARLLSRGSSSRGRPWPLLGRPLRLGAVGVIVLAIGGGVWGLARRNRPTETATSATVSASSSTSTSEVPTASTRVSPSAGEIAPRSRASIRAVDAARFTRLASPPDEQIQLQEGVIALDVVALAAGERFRVVTEDAEVEVRGTRFEVSASHGRLIAVRVTSGRVQVKSLGGALATLDAGDEWVGAPPAPAPPAPAAASTAPPTTTTPRATTAPRPTAAPRATTRSGLDPLVRSTRPSVAIAPPAVAASETSAKSDHKTSDDRSPPAREPPAREPPAPDMTAPPRPRDDRRDDVGKRRLAVASSFDNAWSLLRKGDTQAAAAAFAEVERVAAGSALEEDASYWRAVAVARGGNSASARRLFGAFLQRFPMSARRGEASVALGWLLLEAGQTGDARAAFERAASDPSAPVRASAREGLGRAVRR